MPLNNLKKLLTPEPPPVNAIMSNIFKNSLANGLFSNMGQYPGNATKQVAGSVLSDTAQAMPAQLLTTYFQSLAGINPEKNNINLTLRPGYGGVNFSRGF